ncbi:binding-protein-dependent transport system inner membrane component family protein 62 [Achromobacter xylosoxidans A8]|uniref:Binding-protein-dependent transport system inner membrane component family protein 62 n=2 Tax=Alcaligenes xylosoxydans xylosoxydans TaxID=85698 RepID=E3HXG6_ACHXA|nr:binding-protein-dependent transport system inner membrane component family protein 62 [Achromobacter xylosoxidans A8]
MSSRLLMEESKAMQDSKRIRKPGPAILAVYASLVLFFICIPVAIVVPMSFSSSSTLEFPPPGYSLRWYEAFFGDPRWIEALQNSVFIALISSLIALCLGSVAAYGLVRGRFRGRSLLELNFAAPMVVPHVITGVALYIFFANIGLLGTMGGLVLAHAVLAAPYVVLVVSTGLAALDVRVEQVACTLGASRAIVLWRVVAPNMAPNLFAAWLFAFMISFDEITVTIFLAGTHDTIPKRMFTQLLERIDPTITAVATMLVAVSILMVAAIAALMRRPKLERSSTG